MYLGATPSTHLPHLPTRRRLQPTYMPPSPHTYPTYPVLRRRTCVPHRTLDDIHILDPLLLFPIILKTVGFFYFSWPVFIRFLRGGMYAMLSGSMDLPCTHGIRLTIATSLWFWAVWVAGSEPHWFSYLCR
ncbi:uncharacterized protein F4822DRAFT_101367 [Hypoxylon trugodes]|uniref:uncharacterized protein n=1 Tax=Hypoxylon trugodes TaxID=326681 RepID=UPI0021A1BA53|nr:uncharacterized protein F4822DRAFT_101367 [Hypoxylon trugodes]KAI1382633.1 hypothetical protein F4822DRAFT_101367 [Hypoxylon trugodes]